MAQAIEASNPTPAAPVRRSRWSARGTEYGVRVLRGLAASFSIAVTLGIVLILTQETTNFFRNGEVTPTQFLTGTQWSPTLGAEKRFGVLPLLGGTLYVACVAMLVAIPLGLVTAIYLSEYASARIRGWLKPALEVLAGIPTVVYGLFAITFITPSLRWITDPFLGEHGFRGQNVLAAGIAVGILCLPIVSSLCEDALRAVPRALREGAPSSMSPFESSSRQHSVASSPPACSLLLEPSAKRWSLQWLPAVPHSSLSIPANRRRP